MSEVRLVLCTFPDAAVARQIGTALVEKQYAACVNLIPSVESIYRWQNKVEQESEVLAILKTSAAQLAGLEAELTQLHPYEVPEFVALEPHQVSEEYTKWLLGSVD
ncbi:MAG: divalent-cation tolerance protein CutA [Akkermansiaceae bacterium]|nr:divalent-cation tolerance protein CutA [Akkermansiaceae bacterium]